MTKTEARILSRLKSGFSYAQIQEELNVSSKTIAAVKKVHFPDTESSNDALSDTSASQFSTFFPLEESRKVSPENKFPNTNFLQTNRTMAPENNFPQTEKVAIARYELEEHRLELEHAREMAKLKVETENQQREADLREKELALKQDVIALENRKKEEAFRALLFRLKKLCDECETDDYSYSEVNEMLDKAIELEDELEKFSFINKMTFSDSESEDLLVYIIELLTNAVDDNDEDEMIKLRFSETFLKQRDNHDFNLF